MKLKTATNYIQKRDVVFQKVDGFIHILDQKKDAIVSLNATATLLWSTLAKPHSPDSLATILTNTYEVDTKTAANDVNEFIDTMLQSGFISKISK